MPESVLLVEHENIKTMYDKHIDERHIGLFVLNFKNKMRQVIGLKPFNRKERNINSDGRNNNNRDHINTKTDITRPLSQVMTMIQNSNQMMMENMKNILQTK